MASLKEVKERINSVTSTRKITNAMRMVSSAKLHKAQKAIQGMLPYDRALGSILGNLIEEEVVETPYAIVRPVRRIALVVVSSNSSLCGAFNANVIRAFNSFVADYKDLGKENILVYPIGKKITEAVVKAGFKPQRDSERLAEKASYSDADALANELKSMYVKEEVDKVVLIYHHFRSVSSQKLKTEDYLPLAPDATKDNSKNTGPNANYILEPNRIELINELLPKVLSLKIYTVVIDSSASEHAARMIAMQTASDNADKLISELVILYNKTRQQAITNELLDIIGGSMN